MPICRVYIVLVYYRKKKKIIMQKRKTIVLVAVIIALVGTALFASCDKEEAIRPATKTDATSEYLALKQNHDFAISVISGDSINNTLYGSFGSNIKGCCEQVGDTLYEYTYEYMDDNPFSITKVDDNTASVFIESFSEEAVIQLANINQNNNVVSFDVAENERVIASCTMIVPATMDFVSSLPIASSSRGVTSNTAVGGAIVEAIVRVLVSIFEYDSIVINCYYNMKNQARLCHRSGGVWPERHGRFYRGCSGQCAR